MKDIKLINVLIVIVVLGIVTLGVIKFSGLSGDSKTIDVSESATITKPADRVLINVGVETKSYKSVSDSEEENTKITNKLYESLKSLGLSENEYSTESYNVYTYDGPSVITDSGIVSHDIVTQYVVSHNIKIDTERMNLAGNILDKAIESGANQIYGLQFTLKDDTEKVAREEAYKKASENAKVKADAIADGLNVKITKIVKITDSTVDYYPMFKDVTYAEGSAPTKDIDVNPGEVTVTASISLSYGFR